MPQKCQIALRITYMGQNEINVSRVARLSIDKLIYQTNQIITIYGSL